MADYRQASEFAHFGSDLAPETKQALLLGELIIDAMRQTPAELFSVTEQELVLETVLASAGQRKLNIGLLKMKAREMAPSVTAEDHIDDAVKKLLAATVMEAGA
jgi:F0F1-type ATP synthase alpha subunit